MLYIVIAIIFFSAFFLFYWLLVNVFLKERYIERIQEMDPMKRVVEERKIVQKERKSVFSGIAKLIPKSKNGKMSQKLIRANLTLTAEELLIYRLLFSIALGFLVFVIRQDYFLMGITAVLVWMSPNLWLNSRIKVRLNDFNEQLNGGLVLISNALKAGHSFMQAISIAARETQGTFSDEFKILLKELNFGIPMEIAFANMLERLDSGDMKLVVNAIMIQRDIGGNLSEILENISTTIRERQKIKNEMKTLTAQGKMSGIIVMLMPVFLGGIIYVFNKEYIMLLFQTKVGLALLGISVFNELIGMAIIRKIINIEM